MYKEKILELYAQKGTHQTDLVRLELAKFFGELSSSGFVFKYENQELTISTNNLYITKSDNVIYWCFQKSRIPKIMTSDPMIFKVELNLLTSEISFIIKGKRPRFYLKEVDILIKDVISFIVDNLTIEIVL